MFVIKTFNKHVAGVRQREMIVHVTTHGKSGQLLLCFEITKSKEIQ